MTDCPTCARVEMTRWQRLQSDVLDVVMGPPSMTAVRIAFSAFGRPWYDRHREAYERTGDPAELKRMLRHVPTAQ